MTNQLINTTVTWLKYKDNIVLEDQAANDDILIIKENKIPINEYKAIYKSVGSKYNWIGRLKINETELLKIIYNNSGYGKRLLSFAIKRAKKIGIKPLILQTNSLDHPNALIFYQKNGFQVYSRRNAKVIKDNVNEK